MDEDLNADADLDAGDFASWLRAMRAALGGRGDSDVPCHGCTACCTSSQFVHIEPDETDTLDHIPSELLFPAPGRPDGHVLLGYDERGHCPMLGDTGCSIYEHRPRACRVYDCRVFAATGVEIDEPAMAGVAHRSRRWRFTFGSSDAELRGEAVRAAAAFLDADHSDLPGGGPRLTATYRAVLAIELADLFTSPDPATGSPTVVRPSLAELVAALDQRRRKPRSPTSSEREPDSRQRRTE